MNLFLPLMITSLATASPTSDVVPIVTWIDLIPFELYRLPENINASEARDIARRCDPSVKVGFGIEHHEIPPDGYSLLLIGFPSEASSQFKKCVTTGVRGIRFHYVDEKQ